MNLLTLTELCERREILPDGFGVISGSGQLAEIEWVITKLQESPPAGFLDFFRKFELQADAFSIFWFGADRSLALEIWSRNDESGKKPRWWGSGERPKGRLMIAANDGFVILLESISGRILAFSRDESSECAQVIATDFETFIRGVGTAYLFRDDAVEDGDKLAEFIAMKAGSSPGVDELFFWRDVLLITER